MSSKYPKWVTLYTDANPEGWCAWARADESLPTKKGVRNDPLPLVSPDGSSEHVTRVHYRRIWHGPCDYPDANLAEMRAIIEGTRRIQEWWEGVEGIGIRTDSQTSIQVLSAHKDHRREDFRDMQMRFIEARGLVRVRFKWVKGHQNMDTSVQAYLNNRVDQIAACYTSTKKSPSGR